MAVAVQCPPVQGVPWHKPALLGNPARELRGVCLPKAPGCWCVLEPIVSSRFSSEVHRQQEKEGACWGPGGSCHGVTR